MTPSPRLRRLLVRYLAYRWAVELPVNWHRRCIAEAYFLRRIEPGTGRWVRAPGIGRYTDYATLRVRK